jgi:hypothetical protein
VTFAVDEDILRLQIAICDALNIMQELKYQNNFCRVEA